VSGLLGGPGQLGTNSHVKGENTEGIVNLGDGGQSSQMPNAVVSYLRYRFPPAIISQAVWLLSLHPELPRLRRPPRAPQHHCLVRIHSALERDLRPRVRGAAREVADRGPEADVDRLNVEQVAASAVGVELTVPNAWVPCGVSSGAVCCYPGVTPKG
jgi:hypothetical protein